MKSFEESDSMTNNQYKKMKAFKSRPKILYGSCKVNEDITNVCPPLMLILSEILKSLVTKIKFLEKSQICLVKRSFTFGLSVWCGVYVYV